MPSSLSFEKRYGLFAGTPDPAGAARYPALWADLRARMLLCALFLVSGFGKLAAVAGTQGYMKDKRASAESRSAPPYPGS